MVTKLEVRACDSIQEQFWAKLHGGGEKKQCLTLMEDHGVAWSHKCVIFSVRALEINFDVEIEEREDRFPEVQ